MGRYTSQQLSTKGSGPNDKWLDAEIYTKPGPHRYKVPEDTYCIKVITVGGGGHGYFYGYRHYSGGGGGYAEKWIAVTPGQEFDVEVGFAQCTSSFGSEVSATGAQQNCGGYGSGGDFNARGGNGYCHFGCGGGTCNCCPAAYVWPGGASAGSWMGDGWGSFAIGHPLCYCDNCHCQYLGGATGGSGIGGPGVPAAFLRTGDGQYQQWPYCNLCHPQCQCCACVSLAMGGGGSGGTPESSMAGYWMHCRPAQNRAVAYIHNFNGWRLSVSGRGGPSHRPVVADLGEAAMGAGNDRLNFNGVTIDRCEFLCRYCYQAKQCCLDVCHCAFPAYTYQRCGGVTCCNFSIHNTFQADDQAGVPPARFLDPRDYWGFTYCEGCTVNNANYLCYCKMCCCWSVTETCTDWCCCCNCCWNPTLCTCGWWPQNMECAPFARACVEPEDRGFSTDLARVNGCGCIPFDITESWGAGGAPIDLMRPFLGCGVTAASGSGGPGAGGAGSMAYSAGNGGFLGGGGGSGGGFGGNGGIGGGGGAGSYGTCCVCQVVCYWKYCYCGGDPACGYCYCTSYGASCPCCYTQDVCARVQNPYGCFGPQGQEGFGGQGLVAVYVPNPNYKGVF
jgi:hypothetical protein